MRSLIAARHDNPVYNHNRPGRFWWRRAMFVVVELAIVLWLLVFAARFLSSPISTSTSRATGFYFELLFAIPLIAFFGLLLYSYRHTHIANVEELCASRVSPAETGFALLAWPWVGSLLFFTLPYLFLTMLELPVLISPDPARIPDTVLLSLLRLTSAPFAWLLAMALMTRTWYHKEIGIAMALWIGFGFYLLTVSPVWAIWFLRVDIFETLKFSPGWIRIGDLLTSPLLFLLFAVHSYKSARRHARIVGPFHFSPVHPDPLADVDWSFNQSLAAQENTHPRRNWSAILKAVRPGWRGDVFAWAIGGVLLGVAAWVGATQALPGSDWKIGAQRGVLGWCALIAFPVYVVVFSILFRCRVEDTLRLPLASGSFARTLVPHVAIPAILVIGICLFPSLRQLAVPVFPRIAGGMAVHFDFEEWINTLLIHGAVALASCMVACLVALSLLPRGRRLWHAGFWLVAALLLHFFTLLDMETAFYSTILIFDVEGDHSAGVYGLLFLTFIVYLVFVMPDLPQRLHDREFRGVPRNVVTTEWAERECSSGYGNDASTRRTEDRGTEAASRC